MADTDTDILVRGERPEDVAGIRAVNLAAFPTAHEADLVDALRADPAWIPEFSRVAVRSGEVVAFAVLTRCLIGTVPALALGPVAVLPRLQRSGLGGVVTRSALDAARVAGESTVVVLGHPEYYPRFGFEIASRHGVSVPFEAPEEAVMVASLDDGTPPRGEVRYAPPFGV
ncbi:putative N-acetyltransferase YhbS [Stackebrandtia albiflava]|uniref:Putative N-acetyltransferase YhbS n=1 Tax=Stackebrandtia albiflava TaxID=406432 RepID=A0A562VB25_9ACTN|nr:N-acetyltransferase [Stackebrandtia albiflava]TWJ15063.1 putative N-acetyltransferase YhbS [Stackebrandtia albiflava]